MDGSDKKVSHMPVRAVEVDDALLKSLVKNLYGMKVISIIEFPGYYDRNYHVTVEDTCDNNHVTSILPDGYVVKMLNSKDSKHSDVVDGENQLILHVYKHGIKTPRPVPNIHGELYSLERLTDDTEERYIIRLFEYLPGKGLRKAPYSSDLLFEVGKLAGKLDIACQDFYHPGFQKNTGSWNFTQFPDTVVKYIDVITDPAQRQLLEDVINIYSRDVVPFYSKLKKGVIHADFNEDNILIGQIGNDKTSFEVIGIIDFGDSVLAYNIFEAAILLTHVMLMTNVPDPFEAGGHTLAGYLSVCSLDRQDLFILKECIAARLAQLLILGLYTAKVDPENSKYLLRSSRRLWRLLELLWSKPKDELYRLFNAYADGYGIKTNI